MWQRFCCVVWASLAAAEPAGAGSLPAGGWDPGAERCGAEILALHGVWRPRQGFLPAYADLELVWYLASLGARERDVAVIPVYAPEPVYFRSGGVVFLSTGFILKAGGEKALTDAIRSARVEIRTEELPACAAMSPRAPASFADAVRRLAREVAEYEGATARRLRRRDTGAP
jgi:hypothetical protein